MALNILCWREVFGLLSPNFLEVDFFDVGQGDSAFIQTPEGHQILIDGGPGSMVLERLAEKMPFWDKDLDLVILTHPEKDHMSGILDVLERYKIDHFLWTGVAKGGAENKHLATLLNKAQEPSKTFLAALTEGQPTKVITADAGKDIKAGNALIDILYPFESLAGKEVKATSNDTSVVLKIIFGKNSFLFTGDSGFKTEDQLAYLNELASLESNVLKVAHHGSKYSTSEAFLTNVSPETAVISVGKNSYGHPTAEVLQRLEKFGIKVLRTDTAGDIQMLSDGNKIIIR